MGERVLKGSRLGTTSYETDRNTDLAPRHESVYDCPHGHSFVVPLASEAEIPATCPSKQAGVGSSVHGWTIPVTWAFERYQMRPWSSAIVRYFPRLPTRSTTAPSSSWPIAAGSAGAVSRPSRMSAETISRAPMRGPSAPH